MVVVWFLPISWSYKFVNFIFNEAYLTPGVRRFCEDEAWGSINVTDLNCFKDYDIIKV